MDSQQPMASAKADLKKLRHNTSATADELRAFLAEMRGKSPREMLGTVATSDLGKSLIQATLGVAAAILILTIVPFALGKIFGGSEPGPATPPAAEVAEAAGGGGDAAETPAEPALDPDAKPDRTLDALGIDGSKEAPLDRNPLEDSGDDILKDLE